MNPERPPEHLTFLDKVAIDFEENRLTWRSFVAMAIFAFCIVGVARFIGC